MTPTTASFPWRSLALTTLLPTVLFSVGEGAIAPIIPYVATNLGAAPGLVALVAALLLVGELVGDIPSGVIVARIGERRAMIGGAAVSIAGTIIAFFAPNPVLLGVGIFITGFSSAIFALARHAFLTTVVPLEFRARALSTLGGAFRFGLLIGPFITAGVLALTGVTRYAFFIHIAACLVVAVILLALPDPERMFGVQRHPSVAHGETRGEREVERESEGLFRTLRANGKVLGTVGLGASILAALRASRQVILPLWAVAIGLPESTTSIAIGVAAVLDFALFYLGGSIMDRFGRMWVIVPTTIALAVCHVLLGVSSLLTPNIWLFGGLAMLFALSNGLGAGVLMTLGADLAPQRTPAAFLGAWRFTNDAGSAAAPLLLSGITAVASLPLASIVIGFIGGVGAVMLRVWVPRHVSLKPGVSREPDVPDDAVA